MTHLDLVIDEREARQTRVDAGVDAGFDVEALLIERARRDPEAFGGLYRMHHGAVHRYLFARTGDANAADDLASDVFLAAWRAIPRFRRTGAPFRSWLYRIATNCANRWARDRRRVSMTDRAVESLECESGVEARTDGVDAELAQRALLRLKARHQAVLTLHYIESLSVEEVARILRRPVGTIKSRLSRAREAMRRELKALEDRS